MAGTHVEGSSGGSQVPGSRSPGRSVGPYELISEVGHGNCGRVYLARRSGLERLFALKLLHDGLPPEQLERSQRGARLASRVQHPNVVSPLEVGEVGGQFFLVMEHVPGPNLQERLAQGGPLSWKEAVRIGAEVADALAAAHAQSVVHRDLKPANVILHARTGQAKVTDFGLARDMKGDSNLTRPGVQVGSPYYMSPEQLLGQEVGPASDVYALGVVLFEAIGGDVPFKGRDMHELVAAVRSGKRSTLRKLAPSVPPELVRLIDRLLDPAPMARPKASEVARLLRRGLELSTSRASTFSGMSMTLGLRPVVLVPVVALWVLVLGGVTAWALYEHRSRRSVQGRLDRVEIARDEARARSERSQSLLNQANERRAVSERQAQVEIEELRTTNVRLSERVAAAERRSVRSRKETQSLRALLAEHKRRPRPRREARPEPSNGAAGGSWEGMLAFAMRERALIDWTIARLAKVPESAGLRARLLHNRGRVQEAAELLESMGTLTPELGILLGRTYYKLGNAQKGGEAFARVAREHPDSAYALFGRSLTDAALSQPDRIALLRKAVEVEPEIVCARIMLAQYVQAKRPTKAQLKEAIEILSAALEADPTAYQALLARADAYLRMHKLSPDPNMLEAALKDARHAAALNDHGPGRIAIAQILVAQGRPKDALAAARGSVDAARASGDKRGQLEGLVGVAQVALMAREAQAFVDAWTQAHAIEPRVSPHFQRLLKVAPAALQREIVEALPNALRGGRR